MGTKSSNRWLALPGVALALVLGIALIKLSGGAPGGQQVASPGAEVHGGAVSSAAAPLEIASPVPVLVSTEPAHASTTDEAGRAERPATSDHGIAQPASNVMPADQGAPSHTEQEPGMSSIPLASMGERPSRSAFEGSPGYVPPNDPEANAVVTGRREAPKVDREFTGGASSADELAQQILDALRSKDKKALNALRITSDEFGEILWPEFPASRPITRLKSADAWFFLDADCIKGANAGMDEFGGANLIFDSISYEVGKAPYRNFTLYDGVRIHAHMADGNPVVVSFAQTFAQRNGIWKVYAFKD